MTKKPFFQIALPCLLAGIISAISLLRISLKYFFYFIPPRIQVVIVLIYFAAILLYLLIGLRKKVRAREDSSSSLAFWQNALRYFIALDLCVFGVCKFFHLQFITPLALLDNPFNTLANDDLMWAFFGRSYAFTLVIGTFEIVGALMLLFKKTKLLGVFVLMPICLNIFFLDIFYNGVITSVYIAIEIAGLTYLLLIEHGRLVKFFFIDKDNLPQFNFKNVAWKNAIKVSVIVIPAILMVVNKYPQYYPEINGKYKVKNLVIDSTQQPIPCGSDSILTKVYIDKNDLVLEYNGYYRRFIGSYKYNTSTGDFSATWRYPRNQHDTLFAKILPGKDPDKKTLTGHMGKQNFKIDLQRVSKGI